MLKTTISGRTQPEHVLQCMKGEQQSAQPQPPSSSEWQLQAVSASLNRHSSIRKHGSVDNAVTMQANNMDKYFVMQC